VNPENPSEPSLDSFSAPADDVRPPLIVGALMDVVVWLRSLGLGKYEAVFRENDIDETVLPSLTHENLKELGVASFGHRVNLLDAIAALPKDESVQTAAAFTRPSPATLTAVPVAEAVGERRHITVMFCDLVGSTSISAALDAEEWRDLVGGYLDAASAAVTEMGGHVAKKLGDGLMALLVIRLRRKTTPNARRGQPSRSNARSPK
jgi:SAM domain (Sterile alpha motif)